MNPTDPRDSRIRISRHITEQSFLFLSILKWFILASCVGAAVGLAAAGFFKLLNFSVDYARRYPYYFLALPLALFLNACVRRWLFSSLHVHSTDDVIDHIHERKDIPFQTVLESFIIPVLSIATGGSTGKEAPAADIGAGLGSTLARWLKMNDEDKRKLTICGISAGFACVFGTPIAGALFGVEVLFVGGLLYEVIFPAFVAGIIGYQISSSMGITYFYHPINLVPVFSEAFFIKVAAAGILFGLASFATVELIQWSRKLSSRILIWTPLKSLLGGVVIALIALAFSTRYLGLGLETVELYFSGRVAPWYDPVLKMIVSCLTVNSSGGSGLLTPIFFTGSACGTLFARLLGVDPGTFAAIGFVSLLSGTTNTPIASSILAVEMFGPQIAPYAAVSCVVCFLMAGHRGIYSSQVLSMMKSSSLRVETGKEISEIEILVRIQDHRLYRLAQSALETIRIKLGRKKEQKP